MTLDMNEFPMKIYNEDHDLFIQDIVTEKGGKRFYKEGTAVAHFLVTKSDFRYCRTYVSFGIFYFYNRNIGCFIVITKKNFKLIIQKGATQVLRESAPSKLCFSTFQQLIYQPVIFKNKNLL